MAHCQKEKLRLTNIRQGTRPLQKAVLYNAEEKILCNKVVTMGRCCCHNPNISANKLEVPANSCSKIYDQKGKYTTPQLNAVFLEVNQIEALEAMQPRQYKTINELTPRSKGVIAPKITQRLNFNAEKTVFKNLTPINVNDSILLNKQIICKNKHVRSNTKFSSPELSHFLEPLPELEHYIPEPEINQEFSESIINPYESFLRMYN